MTTITLERAQALNAALVSLGLEAIGVKCQWSDITLLREATLAELIQAGPMVKAHDDSAPLSPDGSRTFSVVCDDRFVAAAYTFLHYALPPARFVDDVDEMVVCTQDSDRITFLIVGHRSVAREEDEQELAS